MDSKTILDMRRKFANDPSRPRFHYLPPSNWMNDPNGVIQWKGQYHLFYQHNPNGAFHADMHWGHAVSDDLIHWNDLPIAIAPTPGTSDEGGVFSGCVAADNNTPTAFYTGANHGASIQKQCMAVSHDNLLTWQKHPKNPIISAPPSEMGQITDFRDPFLWREGGVWYMAVGSRIEGVGGAILLYRSDNLTDWEYLNPLLVGESPRNGIMWECPNLFQLGKKWVLIISAHLLHTTGTVLYFVGDYKNFRFTPEYEGILDHGYYYAPLTQLDDQNRRIMWGWLREGRSIEQQKVTGWSGVQAIPRVLTLDSQNRLNMEPVTELSQIRSTRHQFKSADIVDEFLPVSGLMLEIHATFTTNAGSKCGIALACSPDGKDKTEIIYDGATQTLRVLRYISDNTNDIDTYVQGALHRLEVQEALELDILLDGSVLEIIANKRTSITSRIYSTQSNSEYIRIINSSALTVLEIWEMSSIWQ
jgi:beta-fructofuranosidase